MTALCASSTIDFYDAVHETAAVALCKQCPRREECAAEGREEPYGVWGATTPRDRGFPSRRRTAPTTRDRIICHLTRQWVHHDRIREWTGLPLGNVTRTLHRMKADGIVEHHEGGHWRLA